MPCKSGCCGSSPVATSDRIEIPNAEVVDSYADKDQALPSKNPDLPGTDQVATNESPSDDDAHSSSIPATGLQLAVYEAHASIAQQDCNASREMGIYGRNDCCLASPPETGSDKCCSSRPGPASVDSLGETQTPSCCEGAPAPCCDQSCLDRLALRACLGSDHTTNDPFGSDQCCPTTSYFQGDGKPCPSHVQRIRKAYSEKLEALECICRTLIALGQESCCSPQRRSSKMSQHRRSKDRLLDAQQPSGSCCMSKDADSEECTSQEKCCEKKNSFESDVVGTKCQPGGKLNVCVDSCCGGDEVIAEAIMPDVEKGIHPHETEHVILSISGMTCTGCETKLVRTLGTHPMVKNLKTSLVLSRAEFDVNGTAASVEDIMKHLERTTEFKCERITNRGSSVDVIAPTNATALVNQPWPEGVLDMKALDKMVVSITFDAKIVGARDLLERNWGNGPLQLAPLRPDPTLEAGSKHVHQVGYMTLLSVCLTIPVLVMAWAPLPEHRIAYASASLSLATMVQLFVAGPFYPKAIKALVFSRVVEMDLLVVLSTSAAYIFSVVSFGYMITGEPLSTGEFFETSTLLVTLIMVGRWVAALARQKAAESISLRSLQISKAYLTVGNSETEIDTRLLQYGDIFKVLPDSSIPTDGVVISGSSEVNESMVTGESRPVIKHTGSSVIAGSVNGSGVLKVQLTRLPGDNTISTIASMVDQAKLSKPRIQDIADRVASYFVPVIILITIITFCAWIAIGLRIREQSGSEATIQAITYSITVLIVSCPCAIGLAVPMVIFIASGVAAERGVVIKSGESLEVAFQTSHVVLDKTGTITEGRLTVASEWYTNESSDRTKSLLLGLLRGIKHPVSAGVVKHLRDQGVEASSVSQINALVGKGVQGQETKTGIVLQAGNARWLNIASNTVAQAALFQGYTVFCFTINGNLAAIYSLEDPIRADTSSTVKCLLDRGISVHIVSGDDDGPVRSVASRLNIDESNIRSRCTPADKQEYIQQLLSDCSSTYVNTTRPTKTKKPVVIFCGDGTNDAVALAQATIGVHVNEGGTDIAQSAADVVLMSPNLAGILTLITLSRRSIYRIGFNFGWSFVYNLFAILLAAGAFVNARIPPEFAGLGELVSVLPVIAAAMLLKWSKV